MHPLIREAQKSQLKKVADIKPGYTVRVFQKISEYNKEKDETKDRIQIFEGLVTKVSSGEGVEKTFTVRKIVEGIGVDRVFPIHSQAISKIEVKKKANVRRAKLYYMSARSGKSARLHERHVTDKERADEDAKMEALIQEAVAAEEKRKMAEAKAAEGAVAAESSAKPEETPQA